MRWWLAVVIAGCSYEPHAGGDGGNSPPIDADPDGPPGASCLGRGELRVCLPPPNLPFAVTGVVNTGIDTANPPPNTCVFYDQAGGRPSLCVLAATTITIDANILFVSGPHPLALFASDTIHIGNGVDVGSHFVGQAFGAGADSTACNAATLAGSDGNGGGGGAGGSFGTEGGDGGKGGTNSSAGGKAGAKSDATAFLRGGCRGGDGGDGDAANTGGTGNHGGGAVLLLAGTAIEITGFVNASGAGGDPPLAPRGGGGGGGSGGMIALDAPAVTVTGQLVANGGGGAGGASLAVAGQFGHDPNVLMPAMAAGGGTSGGGQSSDGAAGAAGTTTAGNSPSAAEGAGGAGGGLGQIRVLSGQDIGGTNSPTPELN